MSKHGLRAAIACGACRKRKVKCDGQNPCGGCSNLGIACRYQRPKKVRPLPEQVDHIESLVERIFEEQNIVLSSDDEPESVDADYDPEFGTKRIKLNPMEDPIYSSNMANELLTPRYLKLLGDRVPVSLHRSYKEALNKLGLKLLELGVDLGSVFSSDSPPPKELPKFLEHARAVNSVEKHHLWSMSLQTFMIPGAFEKMTVAENPALYYATLCTCITWGNPILPDTPDKGAVMAWALQNAIRHVIRESHKPPSLDRLRAIVLLFISGRELWIHCDSQVFLSRMAIGICKDLGLNRRNCYIHTEKEERTLMSSLFWASYVINRNLSVRLGCAPAMESDEISSFIPRPEEAVGSWGSQNFIDLFNIYDNLWNVMCSGGAETRSVRQLVRQSLSLLRDLDGWWKSVHPTRSPDSNPTVIVKELRDLYKNDVAVMCLLFLTLTAYYSIKINILRMVALTPASVQDHLTAMFPAEVSAIQEANGKSVSDLQARIASLLSPNYALRKTCLQCMRLCISFQKHDEVITHSTLFIDLLNVTSALTINAVTSRVHCKADSRMLRKAADTVAETYPFIDSSTSTLICSLIRLSADVIDACILDSDGSLPISPAGSSSSTKEDPTPDHEQFELMPYDAARTLEDELNSMANMANPEYNWENPNPMWKIFDGQL